MTSGAGRYGSSSFSARCCASNQASGIIAKRFPVRGLGADVAYGDGRR